MTYREQNIVTILMVLCASISFGQQGPVPRPGWPVVMDEYSIYRTMDTAVATRLPDGTPIFAVSTYHHVALLYLDGSFVEGWPKEFIDPFVVAGPYIGEVDGDGELDVIVALRRASGEGIPHRHICKFSIYGDADTTFTQNFDDPSRPVFSTLCLADINQDGIDEVLFIFDHIHAVDGEGREIEGFPWELGGDTCTKSGSSYWPPALFNSSHYFLGITRTSSYSCKANWGGY